jgi:hypothetical protein
MDVEYTAGREQDDSDGEVDGLTGQIGDMFIDTNNLKLSDNCYYCAVAGAKGLSVTGLVKDSGLMQISGGASIAELSELISTAGVGGGTYSGPYPTFQHASQQILGHSILTFQHASGAHAIRVYWGGAAWVFVDDQNESVSSGYPACFTTWGANTFQIWPLTV